MDDTQTKRLFFALYPSVTTRQTIMTSVSDLIPSSTKLVPSDNLHLTLLFMGASSASQQAHYIDVANTIQADQFDLVLDTLDQFSSAKVLWLGAQQLPEPLLHLHNRLTIALHSDEAESRPQTYRPHITLARNFRGQTPLYPHSINWHVSSFSLMESRSTDQGVRYIELQSWPLN